MPREPPTQQLCYQRRPLPLRDRPQLVQPKRLGGREIGLPLSVAPQRACRIRRCSPSGLWLRESIRAVPLALCAISRAALPGPGARTRPRNHAALPAPIGDCSTVSAVPATSSSHSAIPAVPAPGSDSAAVPTSSSACWCPRFGPIFHLHAAPRTLGTSFRRPLSPKRDLHHVPATVVR
jgi:hypothetical protein